MPELASMFTYKLQVDTKELRLIGLGLVGKLNQNDKADALALNSKLLRLQRERLETLLKNVTEAERTTLLESELNHEAK